MCLAQGPQGSDASEARTRGLWSHVKHSTTEPLCSLIKDKSLPLFNAITILIKVTIL